MKSFFRIFFHERGLLKHKEPLISINIVCFVWRKYLTKPLSPAKYQNQVPFSKPIKIKRNLPLGICVISITQNENKTI